MSVSGSLGHSLVGVPAGAWLPGNCSRTGPQDNTLSDPFLDKFKAGTGLSVHVLSRAPAPSQLDCPAGSILYVLKGFGHRQCLEMRPGTGEAVST